MSLQPLSALADTFEASRGKLLKALAGARDITYIRSYGNIGDDLIFAGTRQLLAGLSYREVSVKDMESATGHTAVMSGGGDWCQPFHTAMPPALPVIEERFERVIVLPSSFDVSNDLVRDKLAQTRALVFARERVSYEQIRGLCNADLAHDCAFYFDFRPFQRQGAGLLRAFRTDHESRFEDVPRDSIDISLTCESLDEWLWTIARHEVIETDRAHVMIAAAMLGKRVEYYPSNYHKVPAIAAFSLSEFPVRMGSGRALASQNRPDHSASQHEQEGRRIQTRGLMRALLLNIPDRELAFLLARQPTILDWGCAMGDGVDILAHRFPACAVTGLDCSDAAIAEARAAFPDHEFLYAPDGSIPRQWDSIVTINHLQRFTHPLDELATSLSHCGNLFLAMVPYNERPFADSHVTQFREESFPAQVGDFVRLFATPIDVSPTYWPDKMLVVAYASASYLEEWETRKIDAAMRTAITQLRSELTQEELAQSYKRLALARRKMTDLSDLMRDRNDAITALKAQLDEQTTINEQTLAREKERMQAQLDQAITERAQAAAECDRLNGELNFVYSTKAWRLSSAYWQARQLGAIGVARRAAARLGRFLLKPFR